MRIGLSIFLIAIGAVLRFALETSVEGINLGVAGVILMAVGALGLVLSMVFWSSTTTSQHDVSPVASTTTVRETTSTDDRGI